MKNLLYIITILGSIQGLLLIILLIGRSKNRSSNKFLSFYIAALIIGLLEPLINDLVLLKENFWILDTLGGISFLYGPLLFLYVRQVTQVELLRLKDYQIHFTPFVLYNILLALVFAQLVTFGKMQGLVELVLYELLFIQIFFYLVRSMLILSDYRKENQFFLSTNFHWLKVFLLLSSAVYLVSFLSSNLTILGYDYGQSINVFIQFALVFLVYLASIKAMFHPDEIKFKQKVLKKPVLKVEMIGKIKSDLIHYMTSQQPYLNKDFNLDVAAKALQTNKYYLSQIVNDQLQKNFPDFVNEYRISVVKEKLHNSELSKYTIFGIASESGFNSKSAFNSAFKKLVGMTPSQYLESNGILQDNHFM